MNVIMPRQRAVITYLVNDRKVTITAMDSVGVEDCMDVLIRATLHRIATGENLAEPIPREVKDWIIKTNLFV